jgi:hypothetical protein
MRCGSIKCFTTEMEPAEEPKNRKGKLLITQSKAGRHSQLAERAAREDLNALKALWACSDPKIRKCAARWGQDGMEKAMRVAFSGQH